MKKIHPSSFILHPSLSNRELLLGLARTFAGFDGTCLLYSGEGYPSSNKSILALFPIQSSALKGQNSWEGLKEQINPLNGKWFGAITYEAEAYFQKYAIVITLDHHTDQFDLHYEREETHTPYIKELRDPLQWPSLIKCTTPYNSSPAKIIKDLDTLEEYTEKIQKVLKHIVDGDIYQVNISQKMILAGKWDPFEIFYKLTKENPAPFSAYLRLQNRTYVSCSPEQFLKKDGKVLTTIPIKGTAPRSQEQEEDLNLKKELLNSPKELSELIMITDLMRNDLASVSLPGTVKVEKLWHCESYPNVHHLMSVIKSQVKPNLHPVDVVKNCFPGGSITGCPKKRAMQIIEEIEDSPRGIYTGSIGYFDGMNFNFNVAIRTLEFSGNMATIQLGGGIVADSDPYLEYQESLHKGRSFFNVFGIKNYHNPNPGRGWIVPNS